MLKKHKTIIVAAITAVIAIAAFIFLREASPLVTAPESPASKPIPASTSPLRIKALIQIKILSKNGNTIQIAVHWENLPEGTTALDIFRSLSQSSIGTLVKTLSIDENSLGAGDAVFTFSGGQGSYFYGSAVSNDGSTLWTSSPTEAITASPSKPSSINESSSPSTTSTTSTPPPSPANNLPSSGSQPPSSSSAAIIYYTPQGQISGSSTQQTANFWVQHVDRKIQIGWQNIPSDTNRLVVSRSASMNGPWTAILTQKNPVTDAPYSLQIVDNTLNDAYHYKLGTYRGSTLTATYGPVLLGPISE